MLTFLIVLSLSCALERDNPLDEGNPNFIPPEIKINEKASSIKNKDTIHTDSLTLSLMGNRNESVFSVELDTNDIIASWSSKDTFNIKKLSEGKHKLIIKSMYTGGVMVVSDTLHFYVLTTGYIPKFENEKDTTVSSFERKTITLTTSIKGASPLLYKWVKGEKVLAEEKNDSLTINSFSIKDTGSYKCIVSNEFGKDTSRTFIIKYHPPTGSIKGIVTDTDNKILDGVVITLLPSDKQTKTKSDGVFDFSSLSENTYTLTITLKGYENKIIEDIRVNDSDKVNLKKIQLIWIDTTTYKVVYKGNGNESGNVPIDSSKYISDNIVKVLDNNDLSLTGYSFSRWDTKEDGSGKSFNPEDSFSITTNVTFYAQWKVQQYTLSFDGKDHTSGSVPKDKVYDYHDKVIISDCDSLKKTGYTFNGWIDDKGNAYAVQDTFLMPDSNMVLYARWESITTHTITYNGNENTEGNCPIDNNTYLEVAGVTAKVLNSNTLEKTDHSFAYWNTKADGSGSFYYPGSSLEIKTEDIILYAIWKKNSSYTVTYDGNGNTGGCTPFDPNFYEPTDVIYIMDNTGKLKKTGYTFKCWNTKSDGSGNNLPPGAPYAVTSSDLTLYAKWIVE